MKKIILTATLILLVTAIQAKIKYGVQAGINHTAMTMDVDDISHKLGIGFYLGGNLEYTLNEKISISPELQFSMTNPTVGSEDITLIQSLSQIELPILVKYYIIKDLSIDFGPRFSYLVGASSTVKYKKEKETNAIDMEYLNAFDFGVSVGATYRIVGNLGVSARYSCGLINLMKNGDDDDKSRSNRGGVQLGVTYQF